MVLFLMLLRLLLKNRVFNLKDVEFVYTCLLLVFTCIQGYMKCYTCYGDQNISSTK
jgi:hypothetical protein